ncbi:TetR/AcrR family transcriptional regulator [Nocardia vinacea]|uniref:TetR/AcrR family transcriptional regulator n=1 Tax=Nocardia vinacea TaxID=96468 RepID=UPI0002D3184A|nr:helix-turn-helix domain-containing protein [Nocardia vinacea]
MTTATEAADVAREIDSRQRLLDVAVALFIRHSFAGTSLQMIADELGFTKAAIYYHFRTREQLLLAVLQPLLQQLRSVIETAEQQRTARTRAESMLNGYAELAAASRSIAAVVTTDPSVIRVVRQQPDWREVIDRPVALLAEPNPGPDGVIAATAVLTGLAGAASGAPSDVDQETLHRQLLDIGRRILGLRRPRTP